MAFDLDGFKRALEGTDPDALLGYFAEDAEWTEYDSADRPPAKPRVMRGKAEIGRYFAHVQTLGVRLELTNGLANEERLAYTITVRFADGRRRLIENAVGEHRDGRITRLMEVEATD